MLTEFGLKIAPSTYYAALTRRPSRRAVRDEELKTMIVKIYEENYSVYGAKKVWLIRTWEDYFRTRRVAIGDGPLSGRIGFATQPTGSGPSSVYYTTGFFRREIQDLCVLIEEIQSSIPGAGRRDWPPILGLGDSVVITLTYLRRNRVQWELAETYGVSQATVSRAIASITPLLARALARYVPTAEELRPDRQYIVEERCFPAGHGGPSRACTRASTRRPA